MKSGIENTSKSEVIGWFGGDEKTQMTEQNRQKKSNATNKIKTLAIRHHNSHGLSPYLLHIIYIKYLFF